MRLDPLCLTRELQSVARSGIASSRRGFASTAPALKAATLKERLAELIPKELENVRAL
jgi:hypothetical protein